MTIFLNLGSNLGNRRMNLSRAVRAVEKEFGYFELSHTIETAPWGYDSENAYLNVGMMITSELPAEEILHRLQKIERELGGGGSHRKEDGTYADRVIDIDIIAIDEMQMNTEELTVPHPKMMEREFVLEPMAELAPFWKHPATGKTCGEMLFELNASKEKN